MKSMNLRLEDELHSAVQELAAVHRQSLTEVITKALLLYIELQGRLHERSWRLGESDGLGSAAAWLSSHAQYIDGEDVVKVLTDCARRIGGLQAEARRLADRVRVQEAGKRWPGPRTCDAHWRVKIDGGAGPPVFVPGEPLVGDYAYDRGRYYLVDEVDPARMELTLVRLPESADMKRLRHEHPERFRSISTAITRSA